MVPVGGTIPRTSGSNPFVDCRKCGPHYKICGPCILSVGDWWNFTSTLNQVSEYRILVPAVLEFNTHNLANRDNVLTILDGLKGLSMRQRVSPRSPLVGGQLLILYSLTDCQRLLRLLFDQPLISFLHGRLPYGSSVDTIALTRRWRSLLQPAVRRPAQSPQHPRRGS